MLVLKQLLVRLLRSGQFRLQSSFVLRQKLIHFLLGERLLRAAISDSGTPSPSVAVARTTIGGTAIASTAITGTTVDGTAVAGTTDPTTITVETNQPRARKLPIQTFLHANSYDTLLR
jgi:hypothetical protein